MFELLILLLLGWLFFHAVKLTLKITWCAAKVIAAILLVLMLPVLAICLLFAGGFLLILPLGMVLIAVALVRACI